MKAGCIGIALILAMASRKVPSALVGRLVEADMTVADLQKGEITRRGLCGHRLADEAERARHAAADSPENPGACPGHALQQAAAVDLRASR
jgi:hypothetical protein